MAVLATAGLALLGGCAGNTGDGSSPVFAKGTITGFGSVVVNGVEFDIEDAVIEVNGNDHATAADLKIGMPVEVEGVLVGDGTKGVAHEIYYNDAVQGPVSNVAALADGSKELTVLGRKVIADPVYTLFRDSTGTPGFDFNSVTPNEVVEVNGLVDANGDIRANRLSRVGFFNAADPGATVIHATGKATLVGSPNSFKLGSLEVDFNASTGGITQVTEGMAVDVEGTMVSMTPGTATVVATRMSAQLSPFPATVAGASVEGFVANKSADGTRFTLNGLDVDVTGVSPAPAQASAARSAAALAALPANSRLVATGPIVNGTMVARQVCVPLQVGAAPVTGVQACRVAQPTCFPLVVGGAEVTGVQTCP
jgi:hypothetical protein